MSEKFCLKWNDYQSNWNDALNELRKDTDFADVTLISDDKEKFSAHKILLSSCSNMFKFILKSNAHGNPLLYLGGVSSTNLGFILDYIYHGEVNIYQEQLDSFLDSAQKLEIEGLLGDRQESPENINTGQNMYQEPNEGRYTEQAQELKTEDKSVLRMDDDDIPLHPRRQYSKAYTKDLAKFDVRSMTSNEIDTKMRELYEKVDGVWRCLVCDHTNTGTKSSNIRMHVETHLDGLSYTCKLCNKEFRCRKGLNNHNTSSHKK